MAGSVSVGSGGGGYGSATLAMQLAYTLGGPAGPPLPVLFNAASPTFQDVITLSPGDNVIDFPAGAGFFAIIIPQPTQASGITITTKSKNSSGDSGEPFVGVLAKGISLAPPAGSGTNPGSIIINLTISGASTLPGVVVLCG